MYRHTLLGMLLLAGLALTIAGCGGGNDDPQTGTLKVGITDQAIQGVESVVLAISEVRVVGVGNENGGTSSLPRIVTFNPARVIDVMDLQFEQQLLGEAVIPAGDYSQVRLVLAPNVSGQEPVNYVTYAVNPTQRVALHTPSGQESGLKVVGRFNVQAGEINTIVLDFDPSRAIVEAGPNLNLKPTGIRIMQLADVLSTFGALTGMVSPAGSRSTAFVSIIPQGQTQPIAKGTVNPETGEFRALLPQGTYYVRIEALGYDGYNGSLLLVPEFFTVIVGQDKAAGEFQLDASN
ncbi:MAG: DUF4382 domain-containing protein [Armatimonadota bacterium]